MGLEVVVNEILARASEEEQRILREAESERQKILDAAEGEADEVRARSLQDTRAKIEALQREQRSAAEFEVRRRLLQAQRELTEDLRKRVLAALADLSKTEREKIYSRLLKKAQKDLPKGRIHARKEDLPILTKNYEKGRELDAVGGFQVESEDGTILLDYRFESLLDGAWKDILAETRKLIEV